MSLFSRSFLSRAVSRSLFSSKTSNQCATDKPKIKTGKQSYKARMKNLFVENPNLNAVKYYIPEKYLTVKRGVVPENLYLIDREVAKRVADLIINDVKGNEEQIVSETNAGLGLIASELLERDLQLVRLYESCTDFRTYLKSKFERYKGRVELFTKDIFLIRRYEYIDKQDNGNRVEQLLRGVPRKKWEDDPAMTIIGALSNASFIKFLIKSLIFQNFLTSVGRIQLYAFMIPRDYIVLSAGPHLNLHTYQKASVIFNLFFDHELLEKFPRKVFLPWQSRKLERTRRYPNQIDIDYLYFVRINFKRNLPVKLENLLPLYVFVQQFFGRGKKRVIPTLEKWIPGCGLNIMLPKLKHDGYFKNLNIFTEFGELTPKQILQVFQETINHSGYERSHFISMVESQMIKTETIETNLHEHLTDKPGDCNETEEFTIKFKEF